MPSQRKQRTKRNPYGNASKPKGRKKNKDADEIPNPHKMVGVYRRKRSRMITPQNTKLLELLKPSEQDVMKLLAAQVHIGRRKCHTNMKRYIWKRRDDGIHVINLEKTWAKLVLAARILVTVRDPSDIAVMSTRQYGQRGAIKFAHYTGAKAMVGKWVPGTFTNPRLGRHFAEPRLLIVDDPNSCFAALRETSYTGIPVISLMGTDCNARFVDCGIPCNNRGKYSVGLMFWLLTRELLRMRGKSDFDCIRHVPWKESVDLFFYRDVVEIKRAQDAKERKAEAKLKEKQMQFGGPQAMEQVDYGQPIDDGMMDEVQPQGGYDAMPPADPQYDLGGQRGFDMEPEQDWTMPQGQEIEDWDQQDQGYGQVDMQQGGYVDPGYGDPQQQQQQQPPQQGADPSMGYVEQDNQAMGMQNW